jgi:hypothetical protein
MQILVGYRKLRLRTNVIILLAFGAHANLAIGNTPHNNFRATVEVPDAADLAVHLSASNLEIAAIRGRLKAGRISCD